MNKQQWSTALNVQLLICREGGAHGRGMNERESGDNDGSNVAQQLCDVQIRWRNERRWRVEAKARIRMLWIHEET